MKHKHADLIKAWADGKQIETWSVRHKKWVKTESPTWNPESKYRIAQRFVFVELRINQDGYSQFGNPNVRFTFENGKLISCDVIKKNV